MPQRILPCETSQVEPSQVESIKSESSGVEWSGVQVSSRVESSRAWLEQGCGVACACVDRCTRGLSLPNKQQHTHGDHAKQEVGRHRHAQQAR